MPPILETDLSLKLSGGAANSDPNTAIGGIKSSTEIAPAALNNLFDNVPSAEAEVGDIEYRCIYLDNTHGTLSHLAAKIWISSNTPSPDSAISIGLDPAGLGDGATTGVATTIADEDTAPAGVAFSAPANEAAALAIGDIPAGESIALWIRRTISATTTAAAETFSIQWKGDTAP